jgi:hypothetical protein
MMSDREAIIRIRVETAVKLVEGLPDDLRPTAFAKVFDALGGEDPESTPRQARRRPRRSSKVVGSGTSDSAPRTSRRRSSGGRRPGATAAIRELIDEDFFSIRRTLPEMQKYLRRKKVLSFKVGDLSSALSKMTRQGELQREENSDGTFEYWAE